MKRETEHNSSCRKTTSTPSNLRVATYDSVYGTHKSLMDFELIKQNKDMKGDDDLGKGSYGRVKLVRDRSDGKLYALKIVKMLVLFKMVAYFFFYGEIDPEKHNKWNGFERKPEK